MSGWLSGFMPGNMSSFGSRTSLNATQALISNSTQPNLLSGIGTTANASPLVTLLSMDQSNVFSGGINALPVNQNQTFVPGDVGTQLQQMLSTLSSMLQALPSANSFMTYRPPQGTPQPNPYGTAPSLPGQAAAQPPITVGGIGIPVMNGRVGPQGLAAIDMGINNAMAQVSSSLASVRL
jgi:hypothetical protein